MIIHEKVAQQDINGMLLHSIQHADPVSSKMTQSKLWEQFSQWNLYELIWILKHSFIEHPLMWKWIVLNLTL